MGIKSQVPGGTSKGPAAVLAGCCAVVGVVRHRSEAGCMGKTWGRVVAMVVLLGGFAAAAEPEPDPMELTGGQGALAELQVTVEGCLKRKDTVHEVFHGCWDWHSAVHAHWALLRIAMIAGSNTAGAMAVQRSLTPAGLAAEEELLRREPAFENPYGRAWLLLLAEEFERWGEREKIRDPDRLRSIADYAAQSLVEKYRTETPDPLSREYDSASWALLRLHGYYRFTGQWLKLATVAEAIETYFLKTRATASFAGDRDDFFSVYGNWITLVAETRPREELENFLKARPIAAADLFVPKRTTDHSLGLVWSRAWAMETAARRIPPSPLKDRLLQAAAAHRAKGMANHRKYKNDYRAYGHWVAQFGIYALTL